MPVVPGHALPLSHQPGDVRLSWPKVIWNGGIISGAVVLPVLFFDPVIATFSAVATAGLLCFGHSVGMHRGVIHGAFKMGVWTERALVYLVVLTGIGGPLALMRMHNTRDRHQNREAAPDYYTFAHSMGQDCAWYLFFDHTGPPALIDAEREVDPFYQFMERTWRWQQLPWAIVLFWAFGWPAVAFGVFGRVASCVVGHWFVNYVCHTRGYRRFRMPGSGEEGRNNVLWGPLAIGEGWHNNHHAFPASARFGIAWWELDPGWYAVRLLQSMRLIWDVKTWQQGAELRPGARVNPLDGVHEAIESSLSPWAE